MDIKIRPMKPEERKYSYTQGEEHLKASGCIGHLRGDMDTDGNGFFTSWDNHCEELKTDKFKAEFDDFINALRFDKQYGGLLKNRKSLYSYCMANPESAFEGNYKTECGFRADAGNYSYMLRCSPVRGDYNFYIYAYVRERLELSLSLTATMHEEGKDTINAKAPTKNKSRHNREER